MGREDVNEEGKAQSLSDLGVPLDSEVLEFAIQDRQEAQELAVQEVEVNDQDDDGDIDVLQVSDLLKLTNSFVVCRVLLFESYESLEDHASDDVDDNYGQRSADHHTVLDGVVGHPVFTVKRILSPLDGWELSEVVVQNIESAFKGIGQTVAVHEPTPLLFRQCIVIIGLLLDTDRVLRALDVSIELLLELVSLVLQNYDSNDRHKDQNEGDEPGDGRPSIPLLRSVSQVLPLDVVGHTRSVDPRPARKEVLALELLPRL
mmetsp:Transcript_11586/g.17527  ORF Transcript_11586/g.17527 Transcript_11586/m.17527 type:complete len:260 (-) Transcript_11586:2131-2910(-)